MAARNASTRALNALLGWLLLGGLSGPLACGGTTPAPALTADTTTPGSGPPAGSAPQPATGDAGQPTAVVFKNVKVFDGKSDKLTASTSVLVVGNQIEKIGGDASRSREGNRHRRRRSDAHAGPHRRPLARDAGAADARRKRSTWDVGYANLVAGAEARDTLLRGFTTVRDVGGPVFGLKRAIDEGVVAGPRIYPSGAMITVTSGHGDFRQPFEVPRTIGSPRTRMEQIGGSLIADSPDEVRVRVREQLMLGASADQADGGWRRRVAS